MRLGPQQIIVVLGMHRSGTSALTGLLSHLGAQTPRSLMPGDVYNPQGYWESFVFHDFHERMLAAAGTSWDSWNRVAPDWQAAAAVGPLGREAIDLLCSEFDDAPLSVLKDPRMSRLMPFWLPTLAEAGIGAKVVIVSRRAAEVARSLERRDGVSSWESLLIWLRHVLDAEADTRHVARFIVACDDLRTRWRDVARQLDESLKIGWPERSTSEDEAISRFLSSGIGSRQTASSELNGVPAFLLGLVTRVENALAGLRVDEAASILALDEVRVEFEKLVAILGDVETSVQVEPQTQIGVLQDRLVELEQREQASKAVNAELGSRCDELRAEIATLQSDIAGLQQRLSELYASKSWRVTAPLRLVWEAVTSGRRSPR